MHVLGIDAGGTQTVCLLADEHGAVLAEVRGAGANLHSAGELEVEKTFHELIERVLAGRAVHPAAVCVGIAGADRENDAQIVTAIMRRIARGMRVLVVNDALIALVAGCPGTPEHPAPPGIVIVAGTGSIVYGRNAQGVAARAGGWGHVIGDEGSGYWIGRHAIAAAVRDVDGRGPRTRLTADVLAHFDVTDPAGLVRVVYARDVRRKSIATLGPVVDRARQAGDPVAAGILTDAADELESAARSVASRLGMTDEPFPFILSGGMFRVVPWLVDELRRRLQDTAPRAEVMPLAREPAVGAIALALAEARGGAVIPKYV